MPYVIVSECEHGFWSNQFAWVFDKLSASVFQTPNEVPAPLLQGSDGCFIDVTLAPEFFLEDPLMPGDCVVLNNADNAAAEEFLITHIKTADGCARRSDDIAVLHSPAGTEIEAYARDLLLL
jgi:hypothetical protein